MTNASPSPSQLGRSGPPTIATTPTIASAIATSVRRVTRSRRATNASPAARIGASACMTSTLATVVWFRAVMNDPEEIAINEAIPSPLRPIWRKPRKRRPRSATAM